MPPATTATTGSTPPPARKSSPPSPSSTSTSLVAAGIAAFELSSATTTSRNNNTNATTATADFITPVKGANNLMTSSSSLPSSPPFSPSTPPPQPPPPTASSLSETTGAQKEEIGVLEPTTTTASDYDGNRSAQDSNNNMTTNETEHALDMNKGDSMGVSEEEEDADDDGNDDEEEEWEEFMANYWKSIGNNKASTTTTTTTTSLVAPLHSQFIVDSEDTDMKPCEIEPDLDEELHALSAIRTGCMDIDMDFNDDVDENKGEGMTTTITTSNNNNAADDDDTGMNQLSMVGLECSCAMANIVVAIVNDSSNSSNSTNSDRRQKNGMEGLRIDVGKLERGWGGGGGRNASSGAAAGAKSNNSNIRSPSQRHTIGGLGNSNAKGTSPSALASPNCNPQMMNTTPTRHIEVSSTLRSPMKTMTTRQTEVSSTLRPPTTTRTTTTVVSQSAYQHTTSTSQQQLLQPQQLNTGVMPITAATTFDIDDCASVGKKSTKSSTTGAAEEGGGANRKHNPFPLPLPELIHATGPIMTRTSLRSLVMKKWHPSYWMQYGMYELLIFRSKDHMDDWRYNPYHGKKQRDFLVKLHIDFMADMIPAAAAEGGGNKGTTLLGHRILPLKKKSYGKNEDEMYQFKLERWTNLGCSVLAAFASQDEDEVQILHNSISEILKRCPNNGLRNIDHMLK